LDVFSKSEFVGPLEDFEDTVRQAASDRGLKEVLTTLLIVVVNVNVILLIEFSISALKITKLSLIAFPVDLQSNGVFQFLR